MKKSITLLIVIAAIIIAVVVMGPFLDRKSVV